MQELIRIEVRNDQKLVSARELYNYLELDKSQVSRWLKKNIIDNDFLLENEDYIGVDINVEGNTNLKDYYLTLDNAKKLAMLSRSKKGEEIRLYFIECEKQLKNLSTPSYQIDDPVKRAETWINEYKEKLYLQEQNEALKPKADYFDALVERNLLTNFRDTAIELKVKQTDFINFLLERKFIYRNAKNQLRAYSTTLEAGLMEYKEFINKYNGKSDVQTLITPKGRKTFRLLLMDYYLTRDFKKAV